MITTESVSSNLTNGHKTTERYKTWSQVSLTLYTCSNWLTSWLTLLKLNLKV